MLIQASEEEQEDTGNATPEFQDEDEYEQSAAAVEFDDSRPVGGLMVSSMPSRGAHGELYAPILLNTHKDAVGCRPCEYLTGMTACQPSVLAPLSCHSAAPQRDFWGGCV